MQCTQIQYDNLIIMLFILETRSWRYLVANRSIIYLFKQYFIKFLDQLETQPISYNLIKFCLQITLQFQFVHNQQLIEYKMLIIKQLSFFMIIAFRCLSLGSVGISFACKMAIRQIKPTKVDSGLAKKLRTSNFIQKFDLSTHEHGVPAQNPIQPITTANQKISGVEQQSGRDERRSKKYKNNPVSPNETRRNEAKPIARTNVQLSQTEEKSKSIEQRKSAPQLQKALATLGKALDSINPKELGKIGIQQTGINQNKRVQLAIQQMKSLDLKDFSILIHKLLVNSSGIINTTQKYIWKEIQEDFLRRFEPTTNPIKIRSYSKVIYSLAKSKVHRDNSSTLVSTSVSTNLQSFETKFALLLPSATHQSFSTIVTSLSRMGPLSQQFCYIAQRLYYSKYNEFNARERVQINYALTRNGKNADSKLIEHIDSMNLKQILIMLRCYQNCGQLSNKILALAEKNIIPRKKQMNIVDIGDICSIYFQAMSQDYRISPELEAVLTEMYALLKKNMNQVAFQKIWMHLPTVVNNGFLQVAFVEQIIKTLKILKKREEFPERIWKPMKENFKEFQNLEIRAKLQDIK